MEVLATDGRIFQVFDPKECFTKKKNNKYTSNRALIKL